MEPIYILGGAQTDFAMNWSRQGLGLFDMLAAVVPAALEDAGVNPEDVDAFHVGNFVGELFARQGQLAGMVAALHPGLDGKPGSRHEAACASGSMAALGAMHAIRAGDARCALVVGVEQMRNVHGDVAASHLGAAAWVGREAEGVKYVWPAMFSSLADEYDARYGLDRAHLVALASSFFANAKRNPNAQTRGWSLDELSYAESDEKNPVVHGRIRKHDCSQITDGAAAIVLANGAFASLLGRTRRPARIAGHGHRTSTLRYEDKVAASRSEPYVFPHVRGAILDAFGRAGIADASALHAIETHDCFTPTAYMAIDHFGLTPPGRSFEAIERGDVAFGGRVPLNPSGGLMGVGHPVGATGVRMLLDAAKQVGGRAGDYQVEGARRVATLNIGGSATTTACFVVEAA
ncbi:MAG: acetyl-CoA acetyltransferase [Polyangiales bacterium]